MFRNNGTGKVYLVRVKEHGYWVHTDNGVHIGNSLTSTSRVEYREWVYDETGWKYSTSANAQITSGSSMYYFNLDNCEVLYTDVDIYADKAMTEVWLARSVAPVSKVDVVTDGFPRLFEVTSANAIVYALPETTSNMVIVIAKGNGGLITGVEYNANGSAWYKISVQYLGGTYEGYISADSVGVGASAPVVTLAPTTAPVASGQATILKNRTAVYEESSASSQIAHYLFEGGTVYVIESDVNGFYYVRYEVTGLNYYGYVSMENVDYNAENGLASEEIGGEVVGQIEDMLSMIKAVPMMIGAVFSFLPPWCLAFVGVAFAFLIALIIYKTARG